MNRYILIPVALALPLSLAVAESGISLQRMADAIHAVISSDRQVYADKVVHRLADVEDVVQASEHWQEDKTLPLPAQMFRAGAELVQGQNLGFSYSLLSLYPINPLNNAKTEMEKAGLNAVAKMPTKNFYGTEKLDGKTYFTAVYADRAVSEACAKCHNDRKDSPKRDFKLNDVMGGVVIRILAD